MPSNVHLYLTAAPPQRLSFQLSNFGVQITCYEKTVFLRLFFFFISWVIPLCDEISVPIDKNFSSKIDFPMTPNFSRARVDLRNSAKFSNTLEISMQSTRTLSLKISKVKGGGVCGVIQGSISLLGTA